MQEFLVLQAVVLQLMLDAKRLMASLIPQKKLAQ